MCVRRLLFFIGALVSSTIFLPQISAADQQNKKIEIRVWHALEGYLYDVFAKIVEQFNAENQQASVVLINKGNYAQTVQAGLGAYTDKDHPHMLQIYEVGTVTALRNREKFVSVQHLMRRYRKDFNVDDIIPVLRKFYTGSENQMYSLPWNSSTGVLFYNKTAFQNAGLDPHQPPQTWEEVEEYSTKLVAAGYKGFTTAWPAAYHLEHFAAWHNIPFASFQNGFLEGDAELVFNQSPHIIEHITKLAAWQKDGIFVYAGRFPQEPEKLFTQGTCGILLQGSNRLSLLKKDASFEIGCGFMPYRKSITSQPYTLNTGGASFWVMEGFSEEEYQCIADFCAYLFTPTIQALWHQKTGYLPITLSAYEATKQAGFYAQNQATHIAVRSVMRRKPTPYTYGVRLPHYIQVRDRIIDGLESVFAGSVDVAEGLAQTVDAANKMLK